MLSYFIRRLLIVPPTLLLITFLVFILSRMVPGGPIERTLAEAAVANQEGSSSNSNSSNLGEEELEDLEETFGLDKPVVVAYLQWLGAWPKESFITKKEIGSDKGEKILSDEQEADALEMILSGTGQLVRVHVEGEQIVSAEFADGSPISKKGWKYRYEDESDRQARYLRRNRSVSPEDAPGYKPRVVLYKSKFHGLIQGQLGNSILYGDSVFSMILARVPIAAYFGVLAALITYGISLPLGVVKAINHRTPIDNITSVLIFFGYSIPGFALGAILLIWLGVNYELFPIFGLTSPDFSTLSMSEKASDLARHTVLPLLCYVIGGFAFLTMMMKNNLMDNLSADYVKTAVSRGAGFSRAVFGHAFKNSLIPIATSLGQLITLFVGGSMLIEKVFDIQGFGLLQYNAVVGLDYPVVMGTLTISSLLVLVGNILSDFIIASIDPRIKFK